jgi:hypothetical protein
MVKARDADATHADSPSNSAPSPPNHNPYKPIRPRQSHRQPICQQCSIDPSHKTLRSRLSIPSFLQPTERQRDWIRKSSVVSRVGRTVYLPYENILFISRLAPSFLGSTKSCSTSYASFAMRRVSTFSRPEMVRVMGSWRMVKGLGPSGYIRSEESAAVWVGCPGGIFL